MKHLIFSIILSFSSFLFSQDKLYLKIGSGSTNNKLTNLEMSGDSYQSVEVDGVPEGYAEIGYKRSESENFRYRFYIGSYVGNDIDGLGAEYGISSAGVGAEGNLPDTPNLYVTGDLFMNLQFIDYSDMRVGSGGDVYTYPADDYSLAIGLGLGYEINNNISIELKYKNHNGVHFSEFPSGTLFWWSFDYSRSGVYGLLNLQLDI
jgi:hypothetical protein